MLVGRRCSSQSRKHGVTSGRSAAAGRPELNVASDQILLAVLRERHLEGAAFFIPPADAAVCSLIESLAVIHVLMMMMCK